jgi:hypothetical protein
LEIESYCQISAATNGIFLQQLDSIGTDFIEVLACTAQFEDAAMALELL